MAKQRPTVKTMNFSISIANADIIDILEHEKNKSEFICEAIREKRLNDQNGFGKSISEGQRNLLKKEIKAVIIEMFGENLQLYGSTSGIPVSIPAPIISKNEEDFKRDNKDIEEKSEENLDLLSSIFNSL